MKLRCQERDLAIVTNPGPFLDKIIRVTTLNPSRLLHRPCWLYEGPLLVLPGGNEQISFYDDILRPIRGAPGQDETLTWARVGEADYAHA